MPLPLTISGVERLAAEEDHRGLVRPASRAAPWPVKCQPSNVPSGERVLHRGECRG